MPYVWALPLYVSQEERILIMDEDLCDWGHDSLCVDCDECLDCGFCWCDDEDDWDEDFPEEDPSVGS